jgi:Staphylococcal nuclease homologue
MRRLPALVALLVFTAPSFVADYPARVVGISDGDTITVLTAEKKQVKIRLNGIDAPETGQDFGTRAKQLASELAFGKTITIKERDKDRYGRTVAEVIRRRSAEPSLAPNVASIPEPHVSSPGERSCSDSDRWQVARRGANGGAARSSVRKRAA